MKRESRSPPIIAIVLLLTPLLYVASYLALVLPGGDFDTVLMNENRIIAKYPAATYRIGDSAKPFFWPLEWIDRQVRPKAWQQESFDPADRTSPFANLMKN